MKNELIINFLEEVVTATKNDEFSWEQATEDIYYTNDFSCRLVLRKNQFEYRLTLCKEKKGSLTEIDSQIFTGTKNLLHLLWTLIVDDFKLNEDFLKECLDEILKLNKGKD